jgi:hypothetical protein
MSRDLILAGSCPGQIVGPRSEKGQGTVEFALAFPIVFVLIVTVLELGFLFNAYVTIVYSAREGARQGALYQFVGMPSCSDPSVLDPSQCRQDANDQNRTNVIRSAVSSSLGFLKNGAPNLVSSEIVVSYNPSTDPSESRRGAVVSVTVQYHYGLLTGVLGNPTGITLRGSASAKME